MSAGKTEHVGVDPGSLNYAIAGLDARGKLTFCRMLNNTVWSTAQKNTALRARYRRAVRGILEALRPRAVMCEEFLVRGFGSHSIELVGLMLGSRQETCDRLGIRECLTMPSSWKRDFDKHVGRGTPGGLPSLYEKARARGVPPHVVDAICLATYLRGGGSFRGASKRLLASNVLAASEIVQPYRKIKPRRLARRSA